jgi:hypothetical protein
MVRARRENETVRRAVPSVDRRPTLQPFRHHGEALMSLFHRSPLGPALRAALLASLAASCVTLVVWRGTGLCSAPGADGGTEQGPPRGLDPDDTMRSVLRRCVEKDRLAAEVIEGRLSLPAAAARYRALDEEDPAFRWEAFRTFVPGRSDDERHCRQVILYVRAKSARQPDADPALAGRLEAELQDRLARGNVGLPGRPLP